ncbi:Uncharacterised protein [Vibrio cholerae]|nr:Uncharacterised protein [Vibrio cholerae]
MSQNRLLGIAHLIATAIMKFVPSRIPEKVATSLHSMAPLSLTMSVWWLATNMTH